MRFLLFIAFSIVYLTVSAQTNNAAILFVMGGGSVANMYKASGSDTIYMKKKWIQTIELIFLYSKSKKVKYGPPVEYKVSYISKGNKNNTDFLCTTQMFSDEIKSSFAQCKIGDVYILKDFKVNGFNNKNGIFPVRMSYTIAVIE